MNTTCKPSAALLKLTGIAAALVLSLTAARAQTSTWADSATGAWTDAANWDTSIVPTSGTAIINNGLVNIASGVTGTSYMLWIGNDTASSGTVVVNGLLKTANMIYVGGAADGLMIIEESGTVTMGSSFRVGGYDTGTTPVGANFIPGGGNGYVIVKGLLTGAQTFAAGFEGSGRIDVVAGGRVSSNNLYIGDHVNASGTINIWGTWDSAGTGIYLGDSGTMGIGTNVMNIYDGGAFKVTNTGTAAASYRVGQGADSSGIVNIHQGGTFSIAASGSASNFYIGSNASGAYGEVNVDGYLSYTNTFAAGDRIFAVAYGGSADVASAIGVLNIGQTGTVNITGASEVAIGRMGVGSSSGANYAVSSSGTINVEGLLTTNNTQLLVARSGDGYLNIASTGTVLAGNTRVANGNTVMGFAYGEINVAGYLGITGWFDIAGTGNGVANILPGGTVTTTTDFTTGRNTGANNPTNTGTLNVWGYAYAGDQFVIGNQGRGYVNIFTGGTVVANTSVDIAIATGSSSGNLNLAGGYLSAPTYVFGLGSSSIILDSGTVNISSATGKFDIPTAVTGAGVTDKTGLGALGIGGDSSAYAGTLNIREGSLRGMNDAGKLGGTVNILSGAILDLRGSAFETTGNLTLADGATIAYSLLSQKQLTAANINIAGFGVLALDDEGTPITAFPVSYTIGTYTAATGLANLDSWGIVGGYGAVFDLSTANTIKINLNAAGLAILNWQGGNGDWDAASTTWLRASNPAKWAYGAIGVFDNATAGTVNVSGLQTFNTLQFDVDGYTLAGTGTLAGDPLAAAITLRTTDSAVNATINTAFNAGNLVKLGPGSITIGGSVTATTIVVGPEAGDGGTLVIAGTATVTAPTGSNAVHVGAVAGASGTLDVSGFLDVREGIVRSSPGDAAIVIRSSGSMNAARAAVFGQGGSVSIDIAQGGAFLTGQFDPSADIGYMHIRSGTDKTSTANVDGFLGVNGSFHIAPYADETAVLTIGQTGTVGVRTYTSIGHYAATGTGWGRIDVAGVLTGTTYLLVGGTGVGYMDIASTGTVKMGTYAYIGSAATASGSVSVAGVFDAGTNIRVGSAGQGVLEILSGGTVLQRGQNNYVVVATDGTTTTGTLIIRSGGHLDTGARGHATQANFGIGWSGQGSLLIETGGTAIAAATTADNVAVSLGYNATGYGSGTIAGTLVVATGYSDIGQSGTGLLAIEDGGLFLADRVRLASNAAGTGTLTLNGGVLEARQVIKGPGAGGIVFNGGTLRASEDTGDFISNFVSLDLGAGALTLDTQAFTVTATNAFTAVSGAALDKRGAGKLILTGNHSGNAGAINVREGAFAVGSGVTLGGDVNIFSGATLDLRSTPLTTAGNATFADGAVWQYSLTGEHLLDVAGTLDFVGSGTFYLARDGKEIINIPGSYTLATYASITGTDNLASWSIVGSDFSLTAGTELDLLSVPNTLKINIGSADVAFLHWQGGNGTWDDAAIAWTQNGSPTAWSDGALAVFSTGSGDVDVTGLRTVFGLQFDTDGYTLDGTGTITASGTLNANLTTAGATATINTALEATGLYKAGPGDLVLGGPATLTGGLTVDNGSVAISSTGAVTTTSVAIATAAPDASVSVAGLLENSGELIVGKFAAATGALDIAATGTVKSASAVIASDADSIGSATVAGLLNNTGALTVGASGAGTLDIAATGTAKSTSASLGEAVGSSGSASVAGLMDVTGALVVGNAGAGDLAVAATGTVKAASATIASQAGSAGSALVEGLLTGTGALIVGDAGNGSLDIASTGTVTAGAASTIGNAVGSSGTANVAGLLDITGILYVGNAGAGVLTVENGGEVKTSAEILVGAANNSTGLLDITGTVTSAAGTSRIAFGEGSTGVVTVRSGGSLLLPSTLVVGGSGAGKLDIEAGATVENANTYIADYDTASGTATVAGTWNMAALTLGQRASGYLGVLNGGVVNASGNVTVANNVAAAGVLDIAEGGSFKTTGNFVMSTTVGAVASATVAGYMEIAGSANQIGIYGVGSLEITETGTVVVTNANNYFLAARYAGSSGTLIVRGFLDTGTRAGGENGNFGIGWEGAAYASISGTAIASGANDSDVAIVIGNNATSVSTLDLSGLLVATKGRVHNGKAGKGTLNIAHTGTLIANGLYSQNSSSTLGIELDPSRTDAYITANSAQLGGTLNLTGAGLDYAPVSRSSELSGMGVLVLTATSGTITGNFATITGMGGAAPDYLLPGGFIITDESTGFADYRAAYRLAWNGPSSAHGTFAIAGGETFEVDTPLGDRVGEASPSWDKKSLTKAGAGTLVLSAENTFTGTLAITSGTVRLGGPELHRFGSLANDGVLDFGTPATIPVGPVGIMAAPPSGITYRTVEVGSLSGNGTLQMTVNPGTGESDRLIVLGKATGAHHINLTASADATAPDGGPAPILTKINGTNSATFTGGLDFDGTNYAIVPASGGNIILATNGEAGVNDAIRGIPGAQSLMWFASQDNLTRRLGELRTPDNAPAGEFALWARARAEHASLKSGTDMRPFKMDLYGLELGGDKTLPLTASRLVIGAYAGYGRATQDFGPREGTGTADGESIQTGLGLYAAWLHDSGWFANLTLSAARFKNELNSADQSGNKTTGDHRDDALGASLEAGKRIALDRAIGKGWFAEPVAQVSIARLERGDYDTTGANTLRVSGKDIAITRLRASVKAGRLWPLAKGMMELSGRLGASHEESSGGEIEAGSRWRPNVDGTRAEAGVGLIWRPTKEGQLYFDYELATGDSYQKPWSVSLGYRHGF